MVISVKLCNSLDQGLCECQTINTFNNDIKNLNKNNFNSYFIQIDGFIFMFLSYDCVILDDKPLCTLIMLILTHL